MQLSDRLLGLLAVAVAVASLIAFSIETQPTRYQLRGFQEARPGARAEASREGKSGAEPARSYDELALRPWRSGPTTSWNVDGASLRRAFARATPPDAAEHALTPTAISDRARNRAYEGAPPMIPHPVAASGAAECLACHATGVQLGSLRARLLPHPAYASCTQCHVSAAERFQKPPPAETSADASDGPSAPARSERSDFVSFAPALFGTRAWPGAPPTIPHSTQTRTECLACHGPGGRAGMRSSHPERASCLQCHAPSAALERRAAPPEEPARSRAGGGGSE